MRRPGRLLRSRGAGVITAALLLAGLPLFLARAAAPSARLAALAGRPGLRHQSAPPLSLALSPSGGEEDEPVPPPAPAPLPPPLPAPPAARPSSVSSPDDPLDVLWDHRIRFTAGGEPLVTIRLAEGLDELEVRPRGPAQVVTRDGSSTRVAAGARVRFSAADGQSARLSWHPQLGDAQHADRTRFAALRAQWERRGVKVRERVVGGVYGVSGRVIDTRRSLLLAAGEGGEAAARAFAAGAQERYGARPAVAVEVSARPTGRVEAVVAGAPLASGESLLTLEVEGDAGFLLEPGPAAAGAAVPGAAGAAAAARPYRGRLHVTLDASGRLAAVLALGLEDLLRGLVPSEIPASAAPAALAAQAVAARSNVLAQLGTRHLDAPWLLCDQVHCQAYHGERAQAAATDAAVRATAGEALFGRRDRRLVDGVYSAVCGGHGEDDDAVWPVLATAALRGRPDLPPQAPPPGDLRGERALRAFVEGSPPAWCARARAVPPRRFRWERRLGEVELDRLVEPLRVGHVRELTVLARGVSGRARALRVTGTGGRAVVEGELVIRRLLGNLPSAMFVIEREGGEVVLRGGGWGHGVGLCQWGAIGRAEAGQGYRQILASYYAGAEVARVY